MFLQIFRRNDLPWVKGDRRGSDVWRLLCHATIWLRLSRRRVLVKPAKNQLEWIQRDKRWAHSWPICLARTSWRRYQYRTLSSKLFPSSIHRTWSSSWNRVSINWRRFWCFRIKTATSLTSRPKLVVHPWLIHPNTLSPCSGWSGFSVWLNRMRRVGCRDEIGYPRSVKKAWIVSRSCFRVIKHSANRSPLNSTQPRCRWLARLDMSTPPRGRSRQIRWSDGRTLTTPYWKQHTLPEWYSQRFIL